MRELAILTFLTLDGVMQAPKLPDEDRSGGFEHGGWAVGCWDEVMAQVRREAMAEPYDFLFGRTTYDRFAESFRDSGDSPEARAMNQASKYVVTSSPEDLPWSNSVPVTGDVAAEIARLKQQDGPLLQVQGSWQLIQTLLEHGLVDLFRLWTFPVVVGSGKRLFGGSAAPSDLKLLKTEGCPGGAVMTLYTRERG